MEIFIRTLHKITIFSVVVLLTLATACRGEISRQPNLVFVFSDQQSSDMLGCYGNDQIITPNIDKMAAAGVRFKHCISSSPVCTPYRGMLMSGQHPLYNGCLVNDIQMLPGNGNYFGEVLRQRIPLQNCAVEFGDRDAFFWDWNGERMKLRPSCVDSPSSRVEYQGYMAMCTNLDDNIGRLLKKLDEKGIRDNTLVIYTSDHGDLLRSHGIYDWPKDPHELKNLYASPDHRMVREELPLLIKNWMEKYNYRFRHILCYKFRKISFYLLHTNIRKYSKAY